MKLNPGDRVQYIRDVKGVYGRVGTVLPSDLGPEFQVRVRWDNGSLSFATPLVQNLRKIEDAPEATVRARVLDEAKRITATDRNSSYGEPEDNFQRIADFWNTFLGPKLKDGSKITPGDTAALMIMVKLAREMNAPKEDNKVDGAGYFACWAEVDARG